jgi:hypothetical protein
MVGTIAGILRGALLTGMGLVLVAPSGISVAQDGAGLGTKIAAAIVEIKNETIASVRIDDARSLSLFIRSQERVALEKLDDKTIDLLASLLEDRLEGERSWIAMSLGDIGPRAKRAVPALESALTDREPVINGPLLGIIVIGPSASPEIYEALEKILGKVPPEDLSLSQMMRRKHMIKSQEFR